MVWLHNDTRTTNSPNGPQFAGSENANINLRAAPLFERSPRRAGRSLLDS
jgi:hypothetical protein